MKKVYIATSREIGLKCRTWAIENVPEGFAICNSIEDADIIISVLYDKIFKMKQLQNKSAFNFHPGVLPDYRGSGNYSWCLINEEKETGITLHLIDEGIDTGDIISIEKFKILKKDTSFSLFQKGERVIFKMFKDWFEKLLREDFISQPQPEGNYRTYYRKDLQNSLDLTRFAKAFSFPNKQKAFYYNHKNEKIFINF